MLALFARPAHPKGWGIHDASAYGYVVVAVETPVECLGRVIEKMQNGFEGLPKRPPKEGGLGQFYGGKFDLLVVLVNGIKLPPNPPRFTAPGDNRFFGIFTAEEVLESS